MSKVRDTATPAVNLAPTSEIVLDRPRTIRVDFNALALAEAMTSTPAEVTDAIFDEARRLFTDEQLVELACSIAMENYRARFNRAVGVESMHTYQG